MQDLLKNGVRLWALDGTTARDKEDMQEYYEQKGVIVDKDDNQTSEYECPSQWKPALFMCH